MPWMRYASGRADNLWRKAPTRRTICQELAGITYGKSRPVYRA